MVHLCSPQRRRRGHHSPGVRGIAHRGPAVGPVRRATEEDLGALLEMVEEFYEIDGHTFDRATVERGLRPLLAGDDHGVALVTDGGYAVLVWSYSLESGGPDALLDELYVREAGRGQGSMLMEEVFVEMRRRGVRRVFLETETGNASARSFYRRLGFEEEESIWMSADLGSES